MRTSLQTAVEPGTVLVTIDGSPTDLAVVEWAAREAAHAAQRLKIMVAAGHLPPDLTFAERDAARRERLDDGHQAAFAAMTWALRRAPGLRVHAAVRLLPPNLLLPAVADQAHTMARSGASWSQRVAGCPRAPVLVGHSHSAASQDLLGVAAGYARRQGVDLIVLEDDGEKLASRLVEHSCDTSLIFLARPEPSGDATLSWPLVLDTYARSRSPVVLVAPEAHRAAARGTH